MSKSIKSLFVILFLISIFVTLIIGLGDTLIPLLFSFTLAYLSFPLIRKLEYRKISRTKSVITVFTTLILFCVLFMAIFLPSLVSDLKSFSTELPEIANNAGQKINDILRDNNVEFDISEYSLDSILVENAQKITTTISNYFTTVVKGIFSGVSKWIIGILNIFLIPLFYFYVVNDYEKIICEIKSFVPRSLLPRISHYAELSNEVLSGYIRGQLLVALCLSILYSVGLSFIGLKFGFVIGLISGLLSIVPYAGFTIGFAIAISTGLANYDGVGTLVAIIVVFVVIQSIEGMFITPKLVGDKVGLSSLATMLVLIIGGNLFGMVGMLLAIPVAAVLKSLVYDFRTDYQKMNIYK